MSHRHSLAFLVLLVCLASVVGYGQGPPVSVPLGDGQAPAPTFRGRVEAVAIDVFVTDAEGNPVSGLTADDFELDENGKRQDITTFQAVDIPVEVREEDRALAEPDVASNDQVEGRVYVIANAIGDPANALKARAFLRTFLDRYFGPNDMAAVVNLGRGLATDGQDFTSNRRLLLAAIDKFSGIDGFDLRDMRDVLDVVGKIPGRHKSVLYLNEGPGFAWGDLIDYQGGVGSLRFDYAHAAMGIATRNNITIYPIDPQGLNTELGISELERKMEIRALAEITGGFAHISSNDFEGAFERIVRDASTYYMLGFNSDYGKNDGKFVGLTVRVKRPGLTVRTRSGYVNATRRELQAAARRTGSAAARMPIVEALSSPLTSAGGHPMRVTAAAYKGAGGLSTVVLTVETTLVMQGNGQRNDLRRGLLTLRTVATDGSRRVYPEVRHQDTLTMPAQVAEITDNRVRLVSEMALQKGRYQIRVASGSERIAGNVVYDLEVPDFTSKPLMIGGLSLAADRNTLPTVHAANESKKVKTKKCHEPSCAAAEVRDVPVVPWSAKTLAATHPLYDALPVPPTTAREFRQADTIAVFTEVYDNKGARPVRVRAELRQPNQEPAFEASQELSASKPRASGGFGATFQLPLAGVRPGRYVLRIEASASEEHTATREIPVNVVP
jgi:VWFA-related protein